MQNRTAIRFLAIALALVCLYQLSFTVVTAMVRGNAEDYAEQFRKQAETYAKGDKGKELEFLESKQLQFLDSVREEGVYNFFWLKDYTMRECEEREINLGLDLKGGMNVTLEISVVDIIRNMADDYANDTMFVKTIARATELQKSSQSDFVTLFGEAFEQVAGKDARLAQFFYSNPDLKDLGVDFNSTNSEILKVINEQAKAAIDNSFNVLRTRIDRFGVSQPNIQRIGGASSGQILVELPGVKDRARVRKLLQGTAQLEFWETYENGEVFQYLQEANNKLKDVLAVKTTTTNTTATNDTTNVSDTTKSGFLTDLADSTKKESFIDAADSAKAEFAKFEKENPLFSVLRPAVTSQNQLAQGAAVGYAQGQDTAKVMEYLRMAQGIFPKELLFFWEFKPIEDADKRPTNFFNLVAIKDKDRDGKSSLSGDVVTNAREEFDQVSNAAKVTMTMNSDGSRAWARITKENINRQVAIVLDNYVYSYPVVRNEIKGGSSEISGNFTITESKDLANVLKSGKLDAPARIIQEEAVGPTLGQESISKGLISFVGAFIMVLLYMGLYYNRAGWVANLALVANLFFLFGVLASVGAVLTLPGLAGIVLTMGMAVDANVLIYERIREEMKLGKGLKLAISDGFKHAYSAIIDSNVTTLLTALMLYIFGTGPIRGFATTLSLGILTSLFSAIFITRLVFLWMLDKNITINFATKLTENIFANANWKFMERRRMYYIISGTIVLLGLISFFVRGFDQGVDFKGGRTYVVAFNQEVNTADVQSKLAAQFGSAPNVVSFGGDNQVRITTKYRIDEAGQEIDQDIETKMFTALQPLLGNQTLDKFHLENIKSSHMVGPTIADDIKVAAVWSVIFALLGIFLYIVVRFRNWRYGLGALVSLAHDVLFVMAAYTILWGFLPFSLEIDQAFIAAILTVVGYSINDTVVIFDRLREHLNLHKAVNVRDLGVYNHALNSTLGRTLSTSATTLVTLVVIFFFGGEVIRGFVFALLIGIAIGTYSSVCIATPVVYDTIKESDTVDVLKQKKNDKVKTNKEEETV